jgi:hypothetical protein
MNQIEKLKEWIESRIEKHEPIGYSERDDIRADECRAILDHLNSLPSAPEDGETESLTAGELLLCDPKPTGWFWHTNQQEQMAISTDRQWHDIHGETMAIPFGDEMIPLPTQLTENEDES